MAESEEGLGLKALSCKAPAWYEQVNLLASTLQRSECQVYTWDVLAVKWAIQTLPWGSQLPYLNTTELFDESLPRYGHRWQKSSWSSDARLQCFSRFLRTYRTTGRCILAFEAEEVSSWGPPLSLIISTVTVESAWSDAAYKSFWLNDAALSLRWHWRHIFALPKWSSLCSTVCADPWTTWTQNRWPYWLKPLLQILPGLHKYI